MTLQIPHPFWWAPAWRPHERIEYTDLRGHCQRTDLEIVSAAIGELLDLTSDAEILIYDSPDFSFRPVRRMTIRVEVSYAPGGLADLTRPPPPDPTPEALARYEAAYAALLDAGYHDDQIHRDENGQVVAMTLRPGQRPEEAQAIIQQHDPRRPPRPFADLVRAAMADDARTMNAILAEWASAPKKEHKP